MIKRGPEADPAGGAGDLLIIAAHFAGIIVILAVLAAVMWRVG